MLFGSGPDVFGFFVKRDIVDHELIREFKAVSKHIPEEASEPLFVMPFHEDDKVPRIPKALDAKIKAEITESFKSRSVDVTFIGRNQIQVQEDSKSLKLLVDLNEQITYDENRRTVRALTNDKLNAVCKKLHTCLVKSALKKTYSKRSRYARYRRYSQKIASVIRTRKGSVRQPFHPDTDLIEGISALAAMNGAFKLIILKNSVQLLRRIAQIRAQWILSGSQIPPELDRSDRDAVEKWFDDSCYAQLVREGWGSTHKLEAYTVTVPEGAVIFFSTWLLHCGHEYEDEDLQTFNRVHMYLVPFAMEQRFSTVRMHRTKVDQDGLSFSSALHFLPRPQPLPQQVQLPHLFASLVGGL